MQFPDLKIALQHLTKRFGATAAVHGAKLAIEQSASEDAKLVISNPLSAGQQYIAGDLKVDDLVLGTNRIDYLSAAPTSGARLKGDLVINSDADAGEAPAWICTASGTPGTWVALPALPKHTAITAASATLTASAGTVLVNRAGAVALTLWASPATGDRVRIKDISGASQTNWITITPAAGTIDGASSQVIKTNYGFIELEYDGTSWRITRRSLGTLISMTAAPTSGAWAKGEIVWNSSPDIGEASGWQCTVAGTPGTWVPFGTVTNGPNWFNFKDYGAIETLSDAPTSAANKVALQATIDAAALVNGTVLIPPGTYWVDPSVNLKVGVTIFGYGATLKQPYQATNFQRMLTTSASTWQQNYDSPPIIIKGLTLVGSVFLGTAWAPDTAYTLGQQRTNGGRLYTVTVAGTSASSGGPTGASTSVDGGVTWTAVDRAQNHGIFIMGGSGVGSAATTPTTTTTGRTRVVVEDVTCKEMSGDGVTVFMNTDAVIRGLRTVDCWRTGLCLNGGWSNVQIQDYRDSGASFQGGFDVEVDSYGYHGTGLGGAVLITVDGMALDKQFDVALLARSEFYARGVTLDRGGFYFTCNDAIARIADSDFAIGKYAADVDRIIYASDTEFRGCTFRPTFEDPASGYTLMHIFMRSNPSTILPKNQRLVFRNCQFILGEEDWVASNLYRTSQEVKIGGNVYICLKPGTSATATAWATSTAYTLGAWRVANGNVYEVTTAGTSHSSGTGPSGTGTGITDGGGTLVWKYISAAGGPSGTGATIVDGTVTWAYLRAASSGTNYGVYCEADDNASNNWIVFDSCYLKGAFAEGIRMQQGGRMEIINTTIENATLGASFNSSTFKYDVVLDGYRVKNVATWANFSGSASNTVTFRNIEDSAANLVFTASATTDVRSGSRVLLASTNPTLTSTPGFLGDTSQVTPVAGSAWRWVATTSSASAATWKAIEFVEGLTQAITASSGTALATTGVCTISNNGAVAVTLPASTYTGPGILFKEIGGFASETNVISFTAGSGTTVEFAHTMTQPYEGLFWYLDGTVWRAR